jgi:hypothetical protein
MTVAFVSCVKTKSDRKAPARELYTSPWFRMAKIYARRHAENWFILSAAHGLIKPGKVIEPYEVTLNRMTAAERKSWSMRVIDQIDELGLMGDRAIVLAGERYREHLMVPLHARFKDVDIPMDGLMMGEQLSWLSRHMQ